MKNFLPDTETTTRNRSFAHNFYVARKALKNPLIQAGLVLGAGFFGFTDGIVLHQILGWHHLVCYAMDCQPTSIAQLQLENTQDGYFHLGLLLVVLAGTAMLFRAGRDAGANWQGRVLLGAILAGGGLFNFLEGLINHQILGLHHVLPGSPHQFLFDMLYLANGLLFIAIGVWLIRSPSNRGQRRYCQ